MGSLLNQAIIFAVNAHNGQLRKGTSIPYILHPLETAAIAATMTDRDDVLAAAVLHDVAEDTDTTLENIRKEFGARVAQLVSFESENKRENLPAESTWKLRKQETLACLMSAPLEVKIIALSDKLSNIRAIHRDYNDVGDNIWQRFHQKDKNQHCWYYTNIAECLSELKSHHAYQEYITLIDKTFH